jgi:hypothetical protein
MTVIWAAPDLNTDESSRIDRIHRSYKNAWSVTANNHDGRNGTDNDIDRTCREPSSQREYYQCIFNHGACSKRMRPPVY